MRARRCATVEKCDLCLTFVARLQVISKKARFATFEIKDLSITAAKVSDRKVEWKE